MKLIKLIIILYFVIFSYSFSTEKDCSQFSTKTFAGLADYVRCKRGLEKSDSNFFKSLKLKNKKQKKRKNENN